MPLVSPERLREMLEYNPATGDFVWLINRGPARVGDTAGAQGQEYRLIRLDGRLYKAHLLAWFWMTGAWPTSDIDHIDGDGFNNRFGNLREVSRSKNMQNVVAARSHSGTGIIGVTLHKPTGRWRARITTQGVERYLGLFDTPEEASAAYWAAKEAAHGAETYQVRLAQAS